MFLSIGVEVTSLEVAVLLLTALAHFKLDSQYDSGSGSMKSLESFLSYPVASEGPPRPAS